MDQFLSVAEEPGSFLVRNAAVASDSKRLSMYNISNII
jgi:hypothetical protein